MTPGRFFVIIPRWSDFEQSEFTLRLGNRDEPINQSIFGESGITENALDTCRGHPMLGIIQDWLSLFLRWAHIIAGIGWIGSSFYFMALDASLTRAANSPEGVKGENWTVHGGGFYHIQKYAFAPGQMPVDLHWLT